MTSSLLSLLNVLNPFSLVIDWAEKVLMGGGRTHFLSWISWMRRVAYLKESAFSHAF